ncbi:MAG: hypothetical protein K9M49_04400 [Candidatus Marinimicrobia bacterium]|nr:hypothetical protein [Candidatus Neomarinimicrobiota bacterium]MCF7850862.1 hypothetical protein [Candidatus Neomarinimicrobiota bacterium]MCF7904377.1 hypothetical protein [Candidatus Neomarinimicrobiota bacterium]
MRLNRRIQILALVFAISFFWNCDSITPQDGDLVDYTCEGCHTNRSAISGIIAALDELSELPEESHAAPG